MTDAANTNDLTALKIDRGSEPRPRRTRLPILIAAAVVVVGAAVPFGLWRGGRGLEVEVTSARAAGSSTPAVLNASGYVTPRRRATVAAKITGRVTEMLVEEGLRVRAGQVLARLDDSEWRAALETARVERDVAARSVAEAEFNLTESDKNLRRARELKEQGLTTEQDLDRAETNVGVWRTRLAVAREQVRAAERRIEQSERNLDNCTVRAPFDGVAVSKDAQVGEIVSPVSAGGGFTRTGISTIVDMDSIEVEVDVSENYIARVVVGQPVLATLDAYPDWQIPAKVRTTIPTADRQKATVKVRIAFDALDPRILPDMGVKVAFLDTQPGEREATRARALVATDAVREVEGRSLVWLVRDGRIEQRAIKTGGTVGSDVAVLAGLEVGDVVVLRAAKELREGQAVRVKK